MKNLFYVFSVSLLQKQFANKLFAFLTLLLLLLPQYACNTTEPPSNQTLSLKLEDVSCTEAWLQLTSTNIQIPNNISLLINGIVKKTFTLNTQDSLLYIDSLLPNQNYSFQVSSIQNPVSSILSNELNVTTMDTTSHNFTWQTFTFGGQAGSSALYDVAIIDENNIWAVGEIYMNDSLGNPDPNLYNLIKWDGISWKPERVFFKNSQGQSFLAPMKSIFALNANDIWIGLDQIIYWNGSTYKSIELPDAIFLSWINKIWGSNSNDIYIVGNSGSIAHYGGPSVGWQKIESGTDLNINDIWGGFNEKTQEWEIIAVAGNKLHGNENIILRILDGNSTKQLNSNGTYWPLRSLWFKSSKKYYVAGSGVYKKNQITESYWKECILDISTYSTNSISGLNTNEIVASGGFGEVLHFNGYSWKSFINQTGLSSGNYLGVDIKKDVCIVVGQNNSNAVVTKGKK